MSCMEKYFQNSLVMIGLETFIMCFCSFTIVHSTLKYTLTNSPLNL